MIPLIALIVGFAVGWRRAGRRGGGSADKGQYAIGHAIGFGLLAFLVTLVAVRLGVLPAAPFG